MKTQKGYKWMDINKLPEDKKNIVAILYWYLSDTAAITKGYVFKKPAKASLKKANQAAAFRMKIGNCYPNRRAAQAVRKKVIKAYKG